MILNLKSILNSFFDRFIGTHINVIAARVERFQVGNINPAQAEQTLITPRTMRGISFETFLSLKS